MHRAACDAALSRSATSRRDDIRTAREGIKRMRTALDAHLVKDDAADAALRQQDGLKAVTPSP